MEIISKIQNSVFVESCCMRGYDFYMTAPAMKELLEKLYLEFPHALSLSCA